MSWALPSARAFRFNNCNLNARKSAKKYSQVPIFIRDLLGVYLLLFLATIPSALALRALVRIGVHLKKEISPFIHSSIKRAVHKFIFINRVSTIQANARVSICIFQNLCSACLLNFCHKSLRLYCVFDVPSGATYSKNSS